MIKTFPVSAASYKNSKRMRCALTHACEVSANGFPIRVLCKRVKLESILADTANEHYNEDPTCEQCIKILLKMVRSSK